MHESISYIQAVMVCLIISFGTLLAMIILLVLYVNERLERLKKDFPRELYEIFSRMRGSGTNPAPSDKGHKG